MAYCLHMNIRINWGLDIANENMPNVGSCDYYLYTHEKKIYNTKKLKVTFNTECHCVKSVQMQRFFWSVFSCIRTEYRKIRTRKTSVFQHFSRSISNSSFGSWIIEDLTGDQVFLNVSDFQKCSVEQFLISNFGKLEHQSSCKSIPKKCF